MLSGVGGERGAAVGKELFSLKEAVFSEGGRGTRPRGMVDAVGSELGAVGGGRIV